MAALASVEYQCSDLRWCYLQQSIFSSHMRTPSFPRNWPSLVSTARSPIILWRLWSHKPSRKHDSNKYQSKVFVICDHKSDETRSVTHENKVHLVWLMFRMLSNQHYLHRANQKLRSWFKIVGFAGKRFLLSPPLPSPVILFFFLPLSQLSRQTSPGNACSAGYFKGAIYLLLSSEGRNKNKNKTRESEVKRKQLLTTHRKK